MKTGTTLTALALAAALASCTMLNPPKASANLVDPTGKAVGTAHFVGENGGTRIQLNVSGLTPGMHGMHIHMNPSCSNSTDASGNAVIFGGAGGHFDPGSAAHHGSPEAANTVGHGGDMPMISVSTDSNGTANFWTNKVALGGANSVIGRSIVIHAAPDDYKTDPAGNSGARVVCGVIG